MVQISKSYAENRSGEGVRSLRPLQLFRGLTKYNYIFFIFPVLFIYEDILGFNGAQLVLAGISIRKLLFAMTLASLYSFWIITARTRSIKLLAFNALDYTVLAFFFINLIWMTAVPLLMHTRPGMAFGEADSIFMLLLYFPCAFFIRNGIFSFDKLAGLIYPAILILAALHVIFYIGLSYNAGFCDAFFNFVHKLSLNTSVKPLVMLGNGYVRVIYPSSIFLAAGPYFFLRRFNHLKIRDYLGLGLVILAVLCTATKSIWFGMAAGFIVYFTVILITNRSKAVILTFCKILAFIFIIAIISDVTIFHGLLSARIKNSFSFSSSSSYSNFNQGSANDIESKDKAGTEISNTVKKEQTIVLLNKWKNSPLIGFGYGSYVADSTRSGPTPYSYEMFLPAMLMKLGIIGLSAWLSFAAFLSVYAIRSYRLSRLNRKISSAFELAAWLCIAVSLILAVQTNPMLLNFCGMGVMLTVILGAVTSNEAFPSVRLR